MKHTHNSNLSIKSIEGSRIPFMLGWIIVFIWLYSYFLPFGNFRFESDLYFEMLGSTLTFPIAFFVSGALLALLFSGERFIKYSFISILFAVALFVLLRYIHEELLATALMIAVSACIGHIFAACCYTFFWFMNNSEKFYSMIIGVFVPKLLLLFKPVLNNPENEFDAANWIIFSLLVIMVPVVILVIKNSKNFFPADISKMPPRKIYLIMPLVFVVLAINDVIAPLSMSALSSKHGVSSQGLYFLGVVVGLVFIFVFQRYIKLNVYYVINISLVFAVMGFVACSIGLMNPVYIYGAAVLFGIAYSLGMVNIYYLSALLTKKFQSIGFYRVGVTLSAGYYLLAIVTWEILHAVMRNDVNNIIAIFTFCSVIILSAFLAAAPFFIRYVGSGEWMDDSYRNDISNESRLFARLKDYSLSPREAQACQKLLEGLTLRQISAEMGISYSTVNTYCTSIYKKLNINSRTELVIIFKEYCEN